MTERKVWRTEEGERLKKQRFRTENRTLYAKIQKTILYFFIIPMICMILIIIPGVCYYTEQRLKDKVYNQAVQTMNEINSEMNTIEVLSKNVLTDDYLAFQVNEIMSNPEISEYEKYRFKTQTMSIIRAIMCQNKIVAARIHIEKDNMREYPPQVYSMERARDSSWYSERKDIPVSGKWFMNVSEQEKNDGYSSYYTSDDMASYVVPLKIGNTYSSNFEIMVPMEEIIPGLFDESFTEDNILLDKNQKIYGANENSVFVGYSFEKLESYLDMEQLCDAEKGKIQIRNVWINHGPVLIAAAKSSTADLIFIRMVSISGEYKDILLVICLGLCAWGIALSIILVFIKRIVRYLLKDVKMFRECVKKVGNGDLELRIPKLQQVEINEIAEEYNQMLANIKRLNQEKTRREVMIKDVQLKSLEKQIDAHFLYNVLDSIKMMAEIEGMYSISSSLLALAKMFRYNLQTKYHDVYLKDEIEYLENYIKLSNIRFDYYINLSKKIDKEALLIKVPKMILQPIVENSIQYGLDELAEDTTIYLKAYVKENKVFVEVSDMGKGMKPEKLEEVRKSIYKNDPETQGEKNRQNNRHGSGIGLHNIHERIQLMYGKNYGLQVYSQMDCFTKVILELPVHSKK